jgi:DNA-binding MarR family transcriptional regulator
MTTGNSAFDDLIHPRQRLMVCATLAAVDEMRFDALAATLPMNTPALSKHLAKLAGAHYVSLRADDRDSRRQWVSLTAAGRRAYTGHLRALLKLGNRSRPA